MLAHKLTEPVARAAGGSSGGQVAFGDLAMRRLCELVCLHAHVGVSWPFRVS
eukprot:NODE_2024_length_1223_cov_2.178876_g1681_i0.p2 GENE.NODE_2024_length_1223_cov_2.178876_g1681_i0~~NODE_2024_length_1223_cov_2.178876_g1681_i0.p2  ORF type:complete len:52 (-),score=3.83 NODE_2024_length_1223_cov_2.178876_g1681_i0:855-1010(-)